MPKTKSKQSTTEVAIAAQVDPRAAMKLVRSEVKNAVKHNHRVDLMGYNGPDIARSQIALQDLLTKEQERHAKARDHIIEQKNMITVMEYVIDVNSRSDGEDIDKLSKKSQYYQEKAQRLSDDLRESTDRNAQLQMELEVTMNTLRVALNGETQ